MEKLYVQRSGGGYGTTELNREYTKKLMKAIEPIYNEMLNELSPIEAEFLIHGVTTDLRLYTLCGLER